MFTTLITSELKRSLTPELIDQIRSCDQWAPSPNKYITMACRALALPTRQIKRANNPTTHIPACLLAPAKAAYTKYWRLHT